MFFQADEFFAIHSTKNREEFCNLREVSMEAKNRMRKEWPRARLWFGDYLNNTTQATANDLLRHALRELDDLYYDIVLHVHDEIVLEVKEEDADKAIEDMTRIMTTPPSWAEGMPLNIGIKKMKRYGK